MSESLARTNSGQQAGPIGVGCARIFREIAGLENSSKYFGWSDKRLLEEPLTAFEIDSLTLLELVMAVETAYGVELDEGEVNNCSCLGDLVELVSVARDGL